MFIFQLASFIARKGTPFPTVSLSYAAQDVGYVGATEFAAG